MHEQAWAELGKIDYFLEHLARAVERGEVHRDSYDLLAPRYLERRAELAVVISGAAARAQAAPAPQPQGTWQPPPAGTPGAASATQAAPATAAYPAPVAAARPRRERKPLSWTTVLVVTGAFLVIVAAAIFALATWELFGPVFQFAFLSTLTVAFYAAGMLVRRRLDSSAGGIALIVVASAMLLFDGWIFISGFGLTGPWPWALWLLVCSAVYWFTETRLTGGVFGVAGAAAEIAWWWLLGEGLGWDPLPRLAGIAVVAALWAWAAEWGRQTPATAPLASVLRYAAPVTAGLAAAAGFVLVGTGDADVVVVLSAIALGWAGTAVAEALSLPRVLGALAHAPAGLAALIVIGSATGGWGIAALLLVASLAAAAYDLIRGSALHGLGAPLLGAAAASALAVTLDLSTGSHIALVAMTAALWPVAGALIGAKLGKLPDWCQGSAGAESTFAFGGIAVLGITTLALAPALGVLPLTGEPWALADTIAVAWVTLAWAIAAFGGRSGAGAAGLVATSFLLLASVLDVADVSWEASLLALPLLALALVWVLVREPLARATHLSAPVLLFAMRVLTPAIVAVGLAVDAALLTDVHWSAGVLLWAAAAWWVADRVIDRQAFSLAPVAVFGAAGAAAFGWWWRGIPADGAVAAAAFALAGVTLGWLLRKRDGMGAVFGWTLVGSATLLAVLAAEDLGSLAFALALVAAAAVVAVISSGWLDGAVVAVSLGTAALVAALAHFDASPWVSVAAFGAAGFACLAPALVRSAGEGRLVRALAAAGLVPLGAGTAIGMLASMELTTARWAALDGHLFAVTLLVVGAYVLAAAVRFSLEPALYAGVGVIVLALFAELSALDARWVELYSTPGALYIAWCGYRWAGRAEGRRVPLAADIGAVVVALGIPFLAMIDPFLPTYDSWVHTFAVFGLAVVAVILGVVLRVRGYFFGGIAALVITALVRSWDVLVLWWWLVLGVVGTGMIVIALARELRQAMAEGVRDLLAGWR